MWNQPDDGWICIEVIIINNFWAVNCIYKRYFSKVTYKKGKLLIPICEIMANDKSAETTG